MLDKICRRDSQNHVVVISCVSSRWDVFAESGGRRDGPPLAEVLRERAVQRPDGGDGSTRRIRASSPANFRGLVLGGIEAKICK